MKFYVKGIYFSGTKTVVTCLSTHCTQSLSVQIAVNKILFNMADKTLAWHREGEPIRHIYHKRKSKQNRNTMTSITENNQLENEVTATYMEQSGSEIIDTYTNIDDQVRYHNFFLSYSATVTSYKVNTI